MSDLSQRAKDIISKIQYATIATVTPDGLPWNSPVFTAYDDEYKFYFGTHVGSQKAKNIDASGKAFLAIYDSTAASGTGEGVYIQADVRQITEHEEVKRAFGILKNRHDEPFWDFAAVSEDGPVRLYEAVPQRVWINDGERVNGHYIDTRTEVSL